MAAIVFKVNKTKDPVPQYRAEAKVILKCGTPMREIGGWQFSESEAIATANDILSIRIKGHMRRCKGEH